jgi:signal peptidase I
VDPTKSDYPFKWRPDGSLVETEAPAPADNAPANGNGHRPENPWVDSMPEAPSPRKAIWLSIVEWGILIASALIIALLIKTFLFQAFYIPSESMSPTLEKNDRVLVNKLSYKMHPVHRADIVVFKAPEGVSPDVKDLVKRVIGLPGETVEGRSDHHVYIDGKKLDEPWLPKGLGTNPFPKYKVPPSSYFVMGDNRPNSNDSRLFPTHFIKKSDIVGRVFVRIWPLNRIDIL